MDATTAESRVQPDNTQDITDFLTENPSIAADLYIHAKKRGFKGDTVASFFENTNTMQDLAASCRMNPSVTIRQLEYDPKSVVLFAEHSFAEGRRRKFDSWMAVDPKGEAMGAYVDANEEHPFAPEGEAAADIMTDIPKALNWDQKQYLSALSVLSRLKEPEYTAAHSLLADYTDKWPSKADEKEQPITGEISEAIFSMVQASEAVFRHKEIFADAKERLNSGSDAMSRTHNFLFADETVSPFADGRSQSGSPGDNGEEESESGDE